MNMEHKVFDTFKVEIREQPEKRALTLRFAVGDITLDDGSVYNIAQSGLTVYVSQEGKVDPELYIDLEPILRHMVIELNHAQTKKNPTG